MIIVDKLLTWYTEEEIAMLSDEELLSIVGPPDGYCKCGCGRKTRLAPQTNSKIGWVKGRPIDYINGHNSYGKRLKRGVSKREYISIRSRRISMAQHIAEAAMGKLLPKGAEIHHVDGDSTNDAPNNLVVCQDRSYHKLLHQRTRAYKACGHASWRKCQYCGKYDNPENMYVNGNVARHRACDAARRRKGTKSYSPKS